MHDDHSSAIALHRDNDEEERRTPLAIDIVVALLKGVPWSASVPDGSLVDFQRSTFPRRECCQG